MAANPVYSNDVGKIAKTIVNADGTSWLDLYDNSAGGTLSARVEALNLTSDDTSTVNIQLGIYTGGSVYLIGTVRAVTLSGTDGAAALINALNVVGNVAPDGIKVIHIPAGGKLQAKSLVAVTAAKTVTLTGHVRTFV